MSTSGSGNPVPVPNNSESVSQTTNRSVVKKKRKAYPTRSKAWNDYKKVIVDGEQRAQCNYCGLNLVAGTTRDGTTSMFRHLKTCPGLKMQKNSSQTTITKEGKVYKYNEVELRKAIAYMVVVDEAAFRCVEKRGFRRVMSVACPDFRISSRQTVTRDVNKAYEVEKARLKEYFNSERPRLCVTTNTWTSGQNVSYMCLTAHYVDKEWKLHKKIINFRPLKASHNAIDLGKAIEDCLFEWGIEQIFTVTVDNATANDGAVEYVRTKISNWGNGGVLDGKFIHMRCMAHIINLLVKDGLREKEAEIAVNKIRAAVKYVRKSPQRWRRFKECVERAKIQCKAYPRLDVSTRWNSTFLMLDSAEKFEKAFDYYSECDENFDTELVRETGGILTGEDWKNARRMNVFLKDFYDLTNRISGSLYVTATILFDEITQVEGWLKNWCESEDDMFVSMAMKMKLKYDKYWGDLDKMNMIVYFGCILDPRRKFHYVKFVIGDSYGPGLDGERKSKNVSARIKEALDELFEWYQKKSTQVDQPHVLSSTSKKVIDLDGNRNLSALEKKFLSMQGGVQSVTELDKYLNEECEPIHLDLDILKWWNINSGRFPILANMARDILAVPISTVPSESAFSTGGRVLDDYQCSLGSNTVETLICSASWLTSEDPPMLDDDEDEDDKVEEEAQCSLTETAAHIINDLEDEEEDDNMY